MRCLHRLAFLPQIVFKAREYVQTDPTVWKYH